MPTLAAGSTFSQALSGGNSVRIQTTHNVSGRIRFVPTNTESPPPQNSSRSFGPTPIDQTFGPWGIPGTVFVDCERGSATTLTYTVNSDAMSQVSITGGQIDSPVQIGVTSPPYIKVGIFAANWQDASGSPGNATQSTIHGRAAFAAAASTVTITNVNVQTANVSVFVQLLDNDATLTSMRVTSIAAGSFTVTGNAAATGTTRFTYLIVAT